MKMFSLSLNLYTESLSYCCFSVTLGIRSLDGWTIDTRDARSLSFNRDYIDIYSNSWGTTDNGKLLGGPGQHTMEALRDGVTKVKPIVSI